MDSKKYMIMCVEESDSSIGLYDLHSGIEISRIRTGFWPHEITIDQKKNKAYVSNFGIKDYDENIGDSGTSISVIDISTFCEERRLFTYESKEEFEKFRGPHGIKVHPDGKRLYVNVELGDEEMLIYDIENGKPKRSNSFKINGLQTIDNDPHFDTNFDLPKGTHNFIFSKNGEFLFLFSGKGGVSKINSETGEVLSQRIFPGNAIRGLSFSKDGLLIASGRNMIAILNPDDLAIENKFEGFGVTQFLYSKPSPDGKYIIAPAVWESKVLIIDIQTGSLVHELGVGIDPIHIQIHPDNKHFFVTHGRSHFLYEFTLDTFQLSRKINTKGSPNGISIVEYYEIPKKQILKLGACLPLSGVLANEGRQIRFGYQYWEDMTNKAGGILIDGNAYNVEVVYRDTRSKGKKDKQFIQDLANELIAKEGVNFLLGSYPTHPNLYIAEVADKQKKPFITASGAGEVIYNQGYDYVYGIMSPARAYLAGTIDLLLTNQIQPKPSTAVFLSCNDNAALEDAIATAKYAISKGLKVISPGNTDFEIVEPGVIVCEHLEANFEKYINKIKDIVPDLFFHTGHMVESISVVNTVKKLDFSPKALAFSVGPAIPKFRDQLGDTCLNLFGSAQWNELIKIVGFDDFSSPDRFAKEFYNEFSYSSSYLSAGAYACGIIIKEGIQEADSLDLSQINQAIKQIDMKTFYADIKFDARGLNNTKPVATIQLRKIKNEDNGKDKIIGIPVHPKDISSGEPIIYPFPGWTK